MVIMVMVVENLLEGGAIRREVSCGKLLRMSTQALSRVCIVTVKRKQSSSDHPKSSSSSSSCSWQTSVKVYSSPLGSLACYHRFLCSHQPHHSGTQSYRTVLKFFFSTIALFLSQRSSPPTAGSVPVFEALLGLGVITIQLSDNHHLHLQFADRALLSIIVLPSKPKRNKGSQARVILRHHLAQCPLQSSRVYVQLKWSGNSHAHSSDSFLLLGLLTISYL